MVIPPSAIPCSGYVEPYEWMFIPFLQENKPWFDHGTHQRLDTGLVGEGLGVENIQRHQTGRY